MKKETCCLIAMDAGGTKTETALFTPEGTVLRIMRTAGINPLVSDFDTACGDCLRILQELYTDAPMPVAGAYIGMPASQYFGGRIQQWLRQHAPVPVLRAEADGYMLISAVLGHADGAAMVCGTGSGLYVRNGDEQYSIGGWGYIIDGCGSGFVLGRRAIRAAVRQADGRGEKTLLTDLVNEQAGGDITRLLPELYAGGRPRFASFAQTVFAARARGDHAAQVIFDACADDLAEMVNTGYGRSRFDRLLLNGGIFRHFPEYVEAVRRRVPDSITLTLSDVPPLLGAAAEALHDAGYAFDEAFRDRFLQGIAG